MKSFIPALLFGILLLSCKGNNSNPEKIVEKDTTKTVIPETNIPDLLPKQGNAGVHPITLQWISWEKPGEAVLTPTADDWYTISGSQRNEDNYLKIEGKIRRISENELEFDGTVETRTSSNNDGEPCVKTGKQVFFAKGNRKYFRLQNMENCEGGNLVDYVDIYPGTSGL